MKIYFTLILIYFSLNSVFAEIHKNPFAKILDTNQGNRLDATTFNSDRELLKKSDFNKMNFDNNVVASCNTIVSNSDNIISTGQAVTTFVLANDIYGTSTATLTNVSISIVIQPTSGSLTINTDGSITYTPNSGFTGNDSYTYKICDNSSTSCCSQALNAITVTSNAVLTANPDYSSTTTGTCSTINVLANDLNNGLTATYSAVDIILMSQPTNGLVSQNSDGTLKYCPISTFSGTECFSYKICPKGTSSSCSIACASVYVGSSSITLNATTDSYSTSTNTSVSNPVLNNDMLNGNVVTTNTVSLSIVTQPIHGTVSLLNGIITYTPTSGYVGTDSYTYSICAIGSSSTCSNSNVSITVSGSTLKVLLDAKAYLQGALFGVTSSTGLMRDNLRTNNLIPSVSPYIPTSTLTTSTGAISSSVLNVSGNNAIVDWVWVELRTSTTQIADSRSALIQSDGDIVDLDGISSITFDLATPGNYYVVVKHRNHLGVMTKNPISLNYMGTTVDFKSSATPIYQVNANDQAQVNVSQGLAMWAGNTLTDNYSIFQGNSNDVNPIYQQIINSSNNILKTSTYIIKNYNNSDINLDGQVIFQGTGNDANYIYQNVLANNPNNILKLNYFIVKEQIP